jgi:phosphoribosylamine--glycine ligase
MAICDGERAALLPAARDYKRARDGDSGPNTGGMGAYAPVGGEDAGDTQALRDTVIVPVLRALGRRGAPFRGVLYAGLMRTAAGWRVLEFNARFGDPETEVVLPLVEGSLFDLLHSAARGRLAHERIPSRDAHAVTVAIVDERYPDAPSGDAMLGGSVEAEREPGVRVLFAGVRREGVQYRITGGRAAYVCALAGSREEARARAYAGVGRLTGRGWRCRHDVAGTPRAVDAARAG